MSKSTENERKLIEQILKNDDFTPTLVDVIMERVTDAHKKRLVKAYRAFLLASKEYDQARNELFEIAPGQLMLKIIKDIEREAESPLRG